MSKTGLSECPHCGLKFNYPAYLSILYPIPTPSTAPLEEWSYMQVRVPVCPRCLRPLKQENDSFEYEDTVGGLRYGY